MPNAPQFGGSASPGECMAITSNLPAIWRSIIDLLPQTVTVIWPRLTNHSASTERYNKQVYSITTDTRKYWQLRKKNRPAHELKRRIKNKETVNLILLPWYTTTYPERHNQCTVLSQLGKSIGRAGTDRVNQLSNKLWNNIAIMSWICFQMIGKESLQTATRHKSIKVWSSFYCELISSYSSLSLRTFSLSTAWN